jgi:hypothetical protein
LSKQARSGLFVATEVAETVGPPLVPDADDLAVGRMATEADVTQASTEPLVEATTGCGDATATSSEQFMAPPPASRHEVEESVATKTLVPAASPTGGVTAEVPASDAMVVGLLEIIDLDAPDLSGNDRDIYEAVQDWMLGESKESRGEAS